MAPAFTTPAPSPVGIAKRQTVVTLTVSALATASTAAAESSKKSFPVAIAIPALVGGMAAAILGALLFWWISKRRRAERQRAREAYERRRRKRANTNASSTRPSVSSDRQLMTDSKSPIKEKSTIPPVPVLPKQAKTTQYAEGKYGAYHDHRERTVATAGGDDGYNTQPSIDEHAGSDPYAPSSGHEHDDADRQDNKQKPPTRPSRSTARVAAAENAAEKAFGDPMTRYNPKQPSPLAIKAQEAKSASQSPAGISWGEGPFGDGPASPTRAVVADPKRLSLGAAAAAAADGRQVSGEWRIAVGTPSHDASFQAQQQQTSYTDDPYLQQRSKSGLYSNDPYASYHDDSGHADIDYHRAAGSIGLGDGARGKTWV